MKSPGVIYRKYRQVKRKLLYFKIAESYRKSHKNCHYGHFIRYRDSDNGPRSTKICMYAVWNDPEGLYDHRKLDICTCASKCNAFAPKKTRDEIVAEFEREVDDRDICITKYPELFTYKWVLDKDLEAAKKKPGLLSRIIVWAINFLEKLLKT